MRYVLLGLLLSGCSLDADLVPIRNCGYACAVDDTGRMVVGAEALAVTCHLGEVVCTDDAVQCVGWTLPSEEVCDPDEVDEDCSGDANNIYWSHYNIVNDCAWEAPGVCQYSSKECINGEMVCVPPATYGPEVCDLTRRDEDCDGLINEEDPDLDPDSSDLLYEGDPDTLNVGACRAGVMRCLNGEEVVSGQVLPTTEICGNNLDDDCDGLTDENEGQQPAEAFVIIMDFSGSMSGVIDAVITALCDWSEAETFSNSYFAIKLVASGQTDIEPYIEDLTGFVSAGEACDALAVAEDIGLWGGQEYMPYAVGTVEDMEWPAQTNRRVVFFTDEPPQGYMAQAGYDLAKAGEVCQQDGFTVSGFVNSHWSEWSMMTDSCGGWLEYLSPDPSEMRDDLDEKFGGECGG